MTSKTIIVAPNDMLFGAKFAHNTMGVLHGDECALCGKRTAGGRGVQFIGYSMDTDEIMRPEDVTPYIQQGGNATLAIIGEDCYYRNREYFKPWVTTVRSKAGAVLAGDADAMQYLTALETRKGTPAPAPEPAPTPEPVGEAPEPKAKRKGKAPALTEDTVAA